MIQVYTKMIVMVPSIIAVKKESST